MPPTILPRLANPPDTFFDGGYSSFCRPYQCGATVKSLDPETRGLVFTQTFRVVARYFEPLPWSTTGPEGSFLVEETPCQAVSGGPLVEWQRVFRHLPPVRVEPMSIAHPYQYIIAGQLGELALTVDGREIYTYFHTLDPAADIPLSRAPRVIPINGVNYLTGTLPGEDDAWILAADDSYARLAGNIYRRTRRQVPFTTLAPMA